MLDHCKHGVYVGGCGVDWMCGACEMGDVEPSPREAEAFMMDAYERMVNGRTKFVMLVHGASAAARENGEDVAHLDLEGLMGKGLNWELHGDFKVNPAFVRAVATWQEACEWAEGPDDDDWLARRHRVLCEQEMAYREGWDIADEIAALPLHVQEGSY